MPSPRRVRLLFMVSLGALITMLFITHRARYSDGYAADGRTLQDFYHKTVYAMDRSGQTVKDPATGREKGRVPIDKDADGDIDADDELLAKEMAERLREAEQKAKELANSKSPNKPDLPSEVIGVGSSAEGQKKKGAGDDEALPETEEEHEAEVVVNDILKRAPVIIFSKSYCPFSMKAKAVLLEKYSIEPAPHVVELDEHPLGSKIQDRLEETTGRRTVPNIMVGGKSIGGSDTILQLDAEDILVDTVKKYGGKGIEMKKRFGEHREM